MLKHEITYTNFLDETLTEEFYFNITKAQLVKMQVGTAGTFSERLKQIIASNDSHEILETLEKFVKDSYGVRTPDGRGHIKSQANWDAFEGSGAYDELFLSFFDGSEAVIDFINGILPSALVDEMAKNAKDKSTPGFRPGAATLPQSRIDQLEREKEQPEAEVAEEVHAMTAADIQDLKELRALRLAKQDNPEANFESGPSPLNP